MIERHYEDEALIALIETERASADRHLDACLACNDKLEAFRMISEALHDPDVWDTRPLRTEAIPATIATLRAFADQTADEDTRAVAILQELLAGSREEWMRRLAEHPEWRTAGVVRGLIAGTSRAIDTMPPDAVAMTALATDIAEHLDVAAQPPNTIARLRGAAWRENAYALYYTGQFSAAESAFFASERHLSSCLISDYELARLGIVRALILRSFEHVSEANEIANASAHTFSQFDDVERWRSARLTQVHLLFSRGDFASAEAVLISLERGLRDSEYADTHARVLGNLGYCYAKLGRTDLAIQHYDLAATLFAELDVATEAARSRWNAAAVFVSNGRVVEAHRRLEEVVEEFEQLGMASEAAVAGLDRAELYLAEGRYVEVEEICRAAMRTFKAAGLVYTERVLTALAFLAEATQQRTADEALVRKVKEYIRRLPAQPNLLFAPGP
jgi:tetratricopeptide (TPR) repeat protein